MYLCTPKSIGKLVSNDLGVWRSPVSAPALGAGGHKFESCYPDDQKKEVLSRAEFPFDASARSPFDKFSGCSAARLARQLRELEVPSSNLGIPTNFLSEPLSDQWLFCLLFFHRIIRRFYRQIEYFPSENVKLNYYIAVFERVVLLCKICEQQTSNRIESLAIESGCSWGIKIAISKLLV